MSQFDLHHELKAHLNGHLLNHPLLRFNHAWPAFFPRLNRAFAFARSNNTLIDLDDHASEIQNSYTQFIFGGAVDTATHYREFGDYWTHPALVGLTSDAVTVSVDQTHENVSAIMTASEMEIFSDLSLEFTVFRAHQKMLGNGCSWTLDYNVALNWAAGLPEDRQISTGIADKRNTIAYISRRGESEILIPAQTVKIVETVDAV